MPLVVSLPLFRRPDTEFQKDLSTTSRRILSDDLNFISIEQRGCASDYKTHHDNAMCDNISIHQLARQSEGHLKSLLLIDRKASPSQHVLDLTSANEQGSFFLPLIYCHYLVPPSPAVWAHAPFPPSLHCHFLLSYYGFTHAMCIFVTKFAGKLGFIQITYCAHWGEVRHSPKTPNPKWFARKE